MKHRRTGTANAGFPLLLPLLCIMATAPLGAQQVSAFARHPTGTALTPPAQTSTAGPRLSGEWHAATPALGRDVMPSSDSHTITLSTIALVLVVVVLVLLIVR